MACPEDHPYSEDLGSQKPVNVIQRWVLFLEISQILKFSMEP